MASVTELAGNDNAPETYKLVVVTEVADRVVTVVPAKLVVPEIFKLVEVAPIPATVKPPSIVVVMPAAPI